MYRFTRALRPALLLAILHPAAAGAQTRTERMLSLPADTTIRTLDPGAIPNRRADKPRRYVPPTPPPPSITKVPSAIMIGDMITVEGTGFVSPSVELYAKVPGSADSWVRYQPMPLQVTSTSFKLYITQDKIGGVNPAFRMRVTTPYGSDTTESEMLLSRTPRVDTIMVGGAWRQVGTPQQWWQRVIWVHGRNLYDHESASVGSTYVPNTDVWRTEQQAVVLQINVPRSCSGQGTVTINFAPSRHPSSGPINAGQVTCLPNDQISAP